jgi:hypothetical protein
VTTDRDQMPDEALQGSSEPTPDEPIDARDQPIDDRDQMADETLRGSSEPTPDEPIHDRRQARDDDSPLLERADEWMDRWNAIQIGFVDEPRDSIAEADALVDEVIKELTTAFSDERKRLEGQWSAGSDPSTEELRVALQRYRSFFNRLLMA